MKKELIAVVFVFFLSLLVLANNNDKQVVLNGNTSFSQGKPLGNQKGERLKKKDGTGKSSETRVKIPRGRQNGLQNGSKIKRQLMDGSGKYNGGKRLGYGKSNGICKEKR